MIEVDSLAKLNAIRWDLDGNGVIDTGTSDADTAKYNAAYPDAGDSMGCQFVDHDDNTATAKTRVCTGYELTKDLDFDTDGDGATYTLSSTGVVTGDAGDTYYNGGKGWVPIGTSNSFTATFDGNDKTISNLFIKNRYDAGLFGYIGIGGRIERLGVRNHNISGRGSEQVGGLAGSNNGTISASYATGSVSGNHSVGGLVGTNSGAGIITGSYFTGSVTGGGNRAGGLAGWNTGDISASYATGSVTGRDYVGGLTGNNVGSVSASYATGSVTGRYFGWAA